jgi:hypothetical protein
VADIASGSGHNSLALLRRFARAEVNRTRLRHRVALPAFEPPFPQDIYAFDA